MIIFKKAGELHNYLSEKTRQGLTTGFIPTMGALHAGHISLAETCKKTNDLAVCSIFVNPTQFNDQKDFQLYPVTIDKDIALLEEAGCDILFLPSVNEIYPNGTGAARHYALGDIETRLEGKYRPGHFQGVCMVVHRLLEIVYPHHLYIGQKDYQQCMVITRLVELTGMGNRVSVVICPTLREPDGLAMSSRNMRLTGAERKRAVTIYKALSFIRTRLSTGPLDSLKEKATDMLVQQGFRVDYVEIADAGTLQPVTTWNGQQRLVALVAAFNGEVRLIDNMLME